MSLEETLPGYFAQEDTTMDHPNASCFVPPEQRAIRLEAIIKSKHFSAFLVMIPAVVKPRIMTKHSTLYHNIWSR